MLEWIVYSDWGKHIAHLFLNNWEISEHDRDDHMPARSLRNSPADINCEAD